MKGARTIIKRHEDLDWVRTLSAASIVLLHTSSAFVSRYSRLAVLGVSPALLCNQITRFAVPVFFLLSGLGLGLSKRPLKLPDFWLHRIRKTGIPYVLWSLFYFLVYQRSEIAERTLFSNLYIFGHLLLTGGAASHLWFVPVLLQLYLLYPGIKHLMNRFPRSTLVLSFLITLISTLTIYIPLPFYGWFPSRLWRLFPTWLFYFILGMTVTEERLETLRIAVSGYALPLCSLTLILSLVYSWISLHFGDLDSIKPELFLYGPFCFLALLSSWKWCGFSRVLAALSAYIARHSMTVYFAHIFFLVLLRHLPFLNQNFFTMLMTFTAVLALSLVTALIPELYTRFHGKKQSYFGNTD